MHAIPMLLEADKVNQSEINNSFCVNLIPLIVHVCLQSVCICIFYHTVQYKFVLPCGSVLLELSPCGVIWNVFVSPTSQ